jgi:hypothetical protein
MKILTIPLTALVTTSVFAADKPAGIPDNYTLQYEQTFSSPDALKSFVFTDPKAWQLTTTNGATGMELIKQSHYKPIVRSPVNIALIADKVFGEFVLEADLMQTGREYGHRDMCIYYGFQTPTNFYYTHIATAADPNAHNCFIVNGAPRKNIARETTKGANWGLGIWHKMRLVRKPSEGVTLVYFDDMTKPIMRADDKTLQSGYIGFGSFDDTGMMDNIRIWAPSMEEKKSEFFERGAK